MSCRECQTVRQINLGFADPKRTYTRAFERHVIELARHTTIQDVADHLTVGRDSVKEIHKRHFERRLSKPMFKGLKRTAIVEISIGKGHKYLTVVLDLRSGAVVFVGDGKSVHALTPFWKRLKVSGAKTLRPASGDLSESQCCRQICAQRSTLAAPEERQKA